ncbi:hypothetical protein ACH5RR_039356 [Cinchona calisaya]|uniref:CCHC-type domain-containing protein n=1 Tax=Cinchona calisaya TaxID=153742 RepID=A0ABD2XYI7_9GENT
MRGIIVKFREKCKCVDFKYEKCPYFCYRCGIIGHNEKDCNTIGGKGDYQGNQFGAWLKANNNKTQSKMQKHGQTSKSGSKGKGKENQQEDNTRGERTVEHYRNRGETIRR